MTATNEPLTELSCDQCRSTITDIVRGYVVWRDDPDGRAYDSRIVHQNDCDPGGEFLNSTALGEFVGPDGLARLLALLTTGPPPATRGRTYTRPAMLTTGRSASSSPECGAMTGG